jgi:CIC family chloride channel protein
LRGDGVLAASAGALALLCFVKLALTVTSYAPGAPGGLFAPLLVIGAALGGALGNALLPVSGGGPDVAAFALCAMAAVFAGSVRAPVTGVVLLVEMTGAVGSLPALALASALGWGVARLLRDPPLYEAIRALGAGPAPTPGSDRTGAGPGARA